MPENQVLRDHQTKNTQPLLKAEIYWKRRAGTVLPLVPSYKKQVRENNVAKYCSKNGNSANNTGNGAWVLPDNRIRFRSLAGFEK